MPESFNVFLSYRRRDATHFAGRLRETISRDVPQATIFRDIDSIKLGEDFVQVLDQQLDSCRAMIVVIGPDWVGLDEKTGKRRIDDPEDFARLEVEHAIDRKIPLIPVLLDGAQLPDANGLPETLRPIRRRQHIAVDGQNYSRTVPEISARLKEILAPPETLTTHPARGGVLARKFSRRMWLIPSLLVLGCAILLPLGYFFIYRDVPRYPAWFQSDLKGVQTLRAFSIQTSLARIGATLEQNDSDRQLLAIRLGAVTKRLTPLLECITYDLNPSQQSEPCSYNDEMTGYAAGLFDLSTVALPQESAQKIKATVKGGPNGNIVDLLEALLAIGKDAVASGGGERALNDDTADFEIRLWLSTPEIDYRPPEHRITQATIAPLRQIFESRPGDTTAMLTTIAGLRSKGFLPLPHRKFLNEFALRLGRSCNHITTNASALSRCKDGLPQHAAPSAPR
jgi:hypothetical protein